MSMNNPFDFLRSYNQSVNEAAAGKSKFYDMIIDEIKATTSRIRPRLDEKGEKILYEIEITLQDLKGNIILDKDNKPVTKMIEIPLMMETNTDDMISGIYSLGSRSSKINHVSDAFIERISNGSYEARVLEKSRQYKHMADSLKETVRKDVQIVVKKILADLSKFTISTNEKFASDYIKKSTSDEKQNLDDLFGR